MRGEKTISTVFLALTMFFLATYASAQTCEFDPGEEENECVDQLSERVGEYGEASFRFGYEVGYQDGTPDEQDTNETDEGTGEEDLRTGFGEDVDDSGSEERVIFGEEGEEENSNDEERVVFGEN